MSLLIAKINTAESLLEIKSLISICLNKIFKETIPNNIINTSQALKKIMTLRTDTISLKQKLADFMYTKKHYPF